MNRRSFIQGILSAGVAPYVVTTAGVLMPVRKLWTPFSGEFESVQILRGDGEISRISVWDGYRLIIKDFNPPRSVHIDDHFSIVIDDQGNIDLDVTPQEKPAYL